MFSNNFSSVHPPFLLVFSKFTGEIKIFPKFCQVLIIKKLYDYQHFFGENISLSVGYLEKIDFYEMLFS